MSKIAPTLQWWFQAKPAGPTPLAKEVEACRAELRALLAVARAAKRERRAVLEVARYGRNTHQGELDGDWIGRMLENSDERLACALHRLDKVSGRKAP